VGARLHVTGGVLKGGRAVEGEAAVAGQPWDSGACAHLFACVKNN